ncbi:MAG: DUF21 domain-containing protein [Alphaproteobacteria bacterium]
MDPALIWLAIAFCVTQSALFSGLNLAFFTISRLRLAVEVEMGNEDARRVQKFRLNSNFLLATVLWGNVGINVLLALLSESVLAGAAAFFFSTFVITIFGEILPQAYFSRNALRIAALLSPILRFYQVVLYPVTKPTAMALDRWLGPEGIPYFREKEMRTLIEKHIEAEETDLGRLEGLGALNFLEIDDLAVTQEGEPVDPASVLTLPEKDGIPVFPNIESSPQDAFLRAIEASGKPWVVLINLQDDPYLAIDADAFLRAALFDPDTFDPLEHCHRPIIVQDSHRRLGDAIAQLQLRSQPTGDKVIDMDLILLWTPDIRHIITGGDILGRLLAGTSRPAIG